MTRAAADAFALGGWLDFAGGPDAALLAGWQEITRLLALPDASDGADDPIWRRISELQELIARTPPATLAGAAVKLRLLCDPAIGIAAGDSDDDPISLDQVLTIVEREAGAAVRSDGDAAIVALFREWIDRQRESQHFAEHWTGDLDAAEYDVAFAAFCEANIWAAERSIAELPSAGAAGLAVKAYLAAYYDGGGSSRDAAALSDFQGLHRAAAALISDAARFLPEIAPLIEGAP